MNKLMKLGDCDVQLIGGQIMSRVTVDAKKGDEILRDIKVIIPKAIRADGSINVEDLAVESLKTEPDLKKMVKAGDIVMKLSTPYDAAIVDDDCEGALVPSFCAIVRGGCDIDRHYLLAFLNSEYCKEQLKNQVAGAAVTVLSVGKIASIYIPVPTREVQFSIGNTFIESMEKLKLIRQIEVLESKKNNIVFRDLVKEYE